MRRQQGEGIREPSSCRPISPPRAWHRRVRAVVQGVAQIGIGAIGAVEPCISKIGAGEVGASRFAPESVAKRSDAQSYRGEVDRAPIHDAHLPLGRAQGSNEVGHRGAVFPEPVVPRSRPATQDFHMRGIGQHGVPGEGLIALFAGETLLCPYDRPMKHEVTHRTRRRAIVGWRPRALSP